MRFTCYTELASSLLFVRLGCIVQTIVTFLVCMAFPPLGLLPMLLLPCLPTVMMKFPFRASHTVLLWFRVMVMLRFLSRAPVFLAFPPPPPLLLFALNLPCRLAAAADALSSMVNSNLLLLLLHTLVAAVVETIGVFPPSSFCQDVK
jgi:hypothetical protein